MKMNPQDDAQPATKRDIRELQEATKRDIRELQEATKRDIRELQEATKRDLREAQNVTKQEIRELQEATKRDLREAQNVTKQEIRGLRDELHAVDQRLDQKIDRVAIDVAKIRGELHEMKTTMVTKDDMRRVNQFVDWAWDKIETKSREDATTPHTLDEHGKQLRDHETRIKRLESA